MDKMSKLQMCEAIYNAEHMLTNALYVKLDDSYTLLDAYRLAQKIQSYCNGMRKLVNSLDPTQKEK